MNMLVASRRKRYVILHLQNSKYPYTWASVLTLVAPISFLLAIPWLRQQPDSIVYLCAGITATITVVGSIVVAIFKDRELDEWHRTAARFSNQWGWLIGAGLVALLLALPPVHDLLFNLSIAVSKGHHPDRTLVLMIFTFGFMITVLAQSACMMLLNAVWRSRMSRPRP